MKHSTVIALFTLVALAVGCASNRDHRSATASAYANENPDGVLVVYSAPDPHAQFNGSPYNIRYSDYSICSSDGAVLQAVHNNTGTMLEGPARVHLPAGKYEIKGRSSTQFVTVPVEVTAHQVTTIHLE